MSTITRPFDGQAEKSVTLKLSEVDLQNNYAVSTDDAGSTVVVNIATARDFQEKVTFRCQELPKVSTGLNLANEKSTKAGYQVIVKDEYVTRTTLEDGTVYDDPTVVYLTVRTTNGNSGMRTGANVLGAITHLLSFIIESEGGNPTDVQKTLDRLIHGATKPLELV